ncbi:MAG: hypothetical protein U9Q34_07605 [Elusimicrobiota bacterium]|nr:hypothetical protein [Elusimicrobiota bacterium]
MKDKKEKDETIIFMDKVIKKSVMPEIYRMAKNNPDGLEASIRGMMRNQGFPTPGSAMVILESDLG